MLTDNEILALERTLVRDNECITHIRRSHGIYGLGNTNTSDYEGSSYDYPLSDYDGQLLGGRKSGSGTQIAACVEDILYIINYSYGTERVVRLRPYQVESTRRGVAYDTEEVDSILPVSHIEKMLETEQGTYRGSVVGGMPEGRGVLEYSENDPEGRVRCEGFFTEGKPDRRCVISYRDGSRFEGWLENGLAENTGDIYYPNGDHFHGYFSGGKRHGVGMLYDKNGNIRQSGWWKNDELQKKG